MSQQMTAVGFEPTPFRTGAWSQRLRPLGQTVGGHRKPGHREACESIDTFWEELDADADRDCEWSWKSNPMAMLSPAAQHAKNC